MTKVLLIIPGTGYGGAHNQAASLAAPLSAHGYATSVLLPDEPGDALQRLRRSGVPVTTMRLRRLRAGRPLNNVLHLISFPVQVWRLLRLIRASGVGIVQVHGIQQLDAALAGRLSGAALVWQLLDTRAPRPLMSALRRPLHWLADAVLVTGHATARAHGIEIDPPRVTSYHPPVPDVSRTRDPAAVRDRLGVPQEATLVGTLANFNPQKGHEVLLAAFALLLLPDQPVRLRLRGGSAAGHDGYWQQLVETGQLVEPGAPIVANLEPELAPPDYVGALDVFVLPSVNRSEGLPTVIIEAMKGGACVVASRVGGVPEMIEDGVTGVLVEPGSAQALAEALQGLIDDPERARGLAAAGQAAAQSAYSTAGTLHSYLIAYRAAQESLDRRT